MAKVIYNDCRGYDLSDPFVFRLHGALDTLEKEGDIKQDEEQRKEIGELALALSTRLDYYTHLLVPAVMNSRTLLLQDAVNNPSGIHCYGNKHLGMTFYLQSMFTELITIDELIKKMVSKMMDYVNIHKNYDKINTQAKDGRQMTPQEVKDLIESKKMKEVQKILVTLLISNGIKAKEWYDFTNDLRNFLTHKGALTIDYIEDNDIFFHKKYWDRTNENVVSIKTIFRNMSLFKHIRHTLQVSLSDVELWRAKIASFKSK